MPIRTGQQAEHTAIPPGGLGGLSGDSWTHVVSHAEACPDSEMLPAEELVATLGRAVAEVAR